MIVVDWFFWIKLVKFFFNVGYIIIFLIYRYEVKELYIFVVWVNFIFVRDDE